MRVLLDTEPCATSATTVGEAIEDGATIAESRGRLIVEVVVDGERWDEAQLGSDEARDATATSVELTSLDRAELVAQTLLDSSDALGHADTLQRRAAERIQADDLPGAMEQLSQTLEIWSQVRQALESSSDAMGRDLRQKAFEAAPELETCLELTDKLDGIRTALVERDPVGLADVLLYEMPDVVTAWRSMLVAIAEDVRGDQ